MPYDPEKTMRHFSKLLCLLFTLVTRGTVSAQPQIPGIPRDTKPFRVFKYPLTVHTLNGSPDNRFLAAGGNAKAVLVWNIDRKSLAKKLKPTGDEVRSVHYSTDGITLAAHSRSFKGIDYLDIWNTTSWQLLQSYSIPSQQIADWSSDNTSYVAVDKAIQPYGSVFGIWDISRKQWTKTFKPEYAEVQYDGICLAGNTVLAITKPRSADHSSLDVFDKRSGKPLYSQPLSDYSPFNITVSSDGQSVVMGGYHHKREGLDRYVTESQVLVWDVVRKKVRGEFSESNGYGITDIAISPNTEAIAAGLGNHHGVQLLNTRTLKPGKVYGAFPLHGMIITFSKDNRQLIVGGVNGEVAIWKIGN